MIDTTITNEWVDVMALPGAPGPVSDGDVVRIFFGDNTSDEGRFIDGVANTGRGVSFATETRIADGGQVEIRSAIGTSTITRVVIFRNTLGVPVVPPQVDITNPNDVGVLTSNEDGTASFVAREQFNTLGTDFVFDSNVLTKIPGLEFNVVAGERYKFKFGIRQTVADAAADIRLQVTGPAAEGITAYQSIENAVSRAPDWGVATLNIAVATIAPATDNPNADLHYAEGWLLADADGVVEINIRDNVGTNPQTIGVGSWVESIKLAN